MKQKRKPDERDGRGRLIQMRANTASMNFSVEDRKEKNSPFILFENFDNVYPPANGQCTFIYLLDFGGPIGYTHPEGTSLVLLNKKIPSTQYRVFLYFFFFVHKVRSKYAKWGFQEHHSSIFFFSY